MIEAGDPAGKVEEADGGVSHLAAGDGDVFQWGSACRDLDELGVVTVEAAVEVDLNENADCLGVVDGLRGVGAG
jgi:hypothetical protein